MIRKHALLWGFYALAVVPVVLWLALVGDNRALAGQAQKKRRELLALEERIAKEPSKVATPGLVQALQARNAELEAQFGGAWKLIRARDGALDRWLPSLGPISGDKLPSPNELQVRLATAMDVLRRDYKDIVEDPASGACLIHLDVVGPGEQRRVMRQYWIVESVLRGLRAAGDPKLRLAAPLEPVSPVKVVVFMKLPAVPKVCRELLAQDVLLRLRTLRSEIIPGQIFESGFYGHELPAGTTPNRIDELSRAYDELPLRVTLELDAVELGNAAGAAGVSPRGE